MSNFEFRPAKRESCGLLVGLCGSSGSGKTFSAMRLATGICGDKPFAVIDTEAGRAKHYADRFRFDHGDLDSPFTPARYAEAIEAADTAGYPVIVVDSASHEHAGYGGLLDMHEAEFKRMGGQDKVKMAAWIMPKMQHKRFVQRLLRVRAHLILCFRAEEKIEIVNGKPQPKRSLTGLEGWSPICEKTLPYELTASFLMTPDAPGIPKPIKLQAQHREMFPAGQPIDEEAGKRIAAWASGGVPRVAKPPATTGDVIPKLLKAFAGLGVSGSDLDCWLCSAVEDAGPAEIERLRELFADLKAGRMHVEEVVSRAGLTDDDKAEILRKEAAEAKGGA